MPTQIKLTNNSCYNIYYDCDTNIVFLYYQGSKINLECNIVLKDILTSGCTDKYNIICPPECPPTVPPGCQPPTVPPECPPNDCLNINHDLFCFIGYFTSVSELNAYIGNKKDTSIAIVLIGNVLHVYMYSCSIRNGLIQGWNFIGNVTIPNTSNFTNKYVLHTPTLTPNQIIGDFIKYKTIGNPIYLPNKHYIINFSNYIYNGTTTILQPNTYFTITSAGKYCIDYNISWLQSANTGSVTNNDITIGNQGGLMIAVVKLAPDNNITTIINTSIYYDTGSSLYTNSSHSFITDLIVNDKLFILAYNNHTQSNLILNIECKSHLSIIKA